MNIYLTSLSPISHESLCKESVTRILAIMGVKHSPARVYYIL